MVGHGNNQSDAHLDIDVYLRARVELCQHSSFESLLEVEAHLSGFAVSVWSPLPLPCDVSLCHALRQIEYTSPLYSSSHSPFKHSSAAKKTSIGGRA